MGSRTSSEERMEDQEDESEYDEENDGTYESDSYEDYALMRGGDSYVITNPDKDCQASLDKLHNCIQMNVGLNHHQVGRQCQIAHLIQKREVLGHWSPSKRKRVSSTIIPEGVPEVMDLGNSRAYIGHFADNGNVFIAGFQNKSIRLYEVNQGNKAWKLRKDVIARSLNWTITDTCMSPNQQLLVYSTVSPVVHVVNINATDSVQSLQNITDLHLPLDFSDSADADGAFGLWCVKFSSDGKHLLAGSSDYASYIYDVESQKVVSRAYAHQDDVNTVAYLDDSNNVYVSGGDDSQIMVWDSRCCTNGILNKPQGRLEGHTEGLTYISAKGDGNFFISNAKDQKCKLWDIRLISSGRRTTKQKVPRFYWDYRWQSYPGVPREVQHPCDRSLMTFTGHAVLQTLIRCRWSPMETTGQRYILSGSQCGSLFVYDVLTGEKTAELRFHRSVVRDCDWHPDLPLVGSVGWDGSVVRWEHHSTCA